MRFDFFSGLIDVINAQRYEVLKENVNNVIYYLNKSIQALDNIDEVLDKSYNINDSSVRNIGVESLRNDLINRVDYLKNTIIPSIDLKIKS